MNTTSRAQFQRPSLAYASSALAKRRLTVVIPHRIQKMSPYTKLPLKVSSSSESTTAGNIAAKLAAAMALRRGDLALRQSI